MASVENSYIITTVVTDSNPLAVNSQNLSDTNSFSVRVTSGPVIDLTSATLALEGCLPTNGVIDSGETVTVLFTLRNTGGANTTNLVATLLPTNGVAAPSAPQSYGMLVAGGAAVSLPLSFTAAGTCGSTITPTLQLQDGAADLGTLSASFILGQLKNLVILTQNFDSVTAPALPSGWTTVKSGAGANWRTTNSIVDTTPNAAYAANAGNLGTADLLSPSINLTNASGPFVLSFRNNYDLEYDFNGYYDGGVLEIKIGGNAFVDITNAGGAFLSGGYNAVISTNPQFQSPIAGRPAWSGISGGFITTTVSLPSSVAGQTIQLRWRCATDTGGPPGAGWRIDSIGMTGNGYACCLNTAPVLPDQTDRTIDELSTLTVTNRATDAEAPPESLTYSVVIAPVASPGDAVANAAVSTNGVITWTPTEAQGPGIYTVTTVVNDSANPSLRDTNSFLVTVNEVNSAPVLTVPSNQAIDPLLPWSAYATAIDTDSPPNLLTFELVSGPDGLTVSASGQMSWTPTQGQMTSTNTVTVRVFDNGTPRLYDTNSFILTVSSSTNEPPPIIQSVTVSNSTARITWSSVPGRTYLLQYQEAVPGTNWIDLPPELQAIGSTTTTTNAPGSVTQRFYRVYRVR
jgi:hypothetical protein